MISGAPQHMESTFDYVESQLTLTFGRVRVGEVVLSSWTLRRGKESADWTNSWNSSGPQMQDKFNSELSFFQDMKMSHTHARTGIEGHTK